MICWSRKGELLRRALVFGGGGFIGGHLTKKLQSQGVWVRSVDIKRHQYGVEGDDFVLGDLTDLNFVREVLTLENNFSFDEIYQLAADMGGAGYIFTGENDANIMHNSASINLNLMKSLVDLKDETSVRNTKIFFSSSACVYPENKQEEVANPGLKESDAYPANPDSEYGWEKLFSERLFLSYARNYGLDVRIGRFHNIFGPEGTWQGGKEKAPAAICRKVALASNPGFIEIWGDGLQTRSFLYIDDCLEAVGRLMASEYKQPINIGSDESVTINQLVEYAASFERKEISIKHTPGPQGVRGRNSNNDTVKKVLDWRKQRPLIEGLKLTYYWIKEQIERTATTEVGQVTKG